MNKLKTFYLYGHMDRVGWPKVLYSERLALTNLIQKDHFQLYCDSRHYNLHFKRFSRKSCIFIDSNIEDKRKKKFWVHDFLF